ncbi:uncharacterized protein LOC111131466 isoform X4 [Crassostrea virginica]
MSDNEKDMEDNGPQKTVSDTKKESEAPKQEEARPKREDTPPPKKPVSAAPVAKPENTKDKGEKQEQQKSRDEADDEQKQTADDKKDDDAGVRKVTFDARDESTTGNIVSKSTEGDGGQENGNNTKGQTESESRNEEANVVSKSEIINTSDIKSNNENYKEPEKETPQEEIPAENTNSRVDTEPEKNSGNKDSKESERVEQNMEDTQEETKQTQQQNPSKDNNIVETKVDSKKPEEKKDDGYVPLDQKWSSTKREFKGVQREYSFDYSRRSPSSTSSYLERRRSEEREKAAKDDQAESQIQSKNEDNSIGEKNDKSIENQTSTKSTSERDESREERKETVIESFNDNETNKSSALRKSSDGEYKESVSSPRREDQEKSESVQREKEGQKRESISSPRRDDQEESDKLQKVEEDRKKEEKTEVLKKDDDEGDWRFVTEKSSNNKGNSKAPEKDTERNDVENVQSDNHNDADRNDDIRAKEDDYSDREETKSPKTRDHVKYKDEKFESESEDNISVVDTTPYRPEPKEEPKKEPTKETKEPAKGKKEPAKKTKEPSKKSSFSSPSPRPSSQPNKNLQRPVARSAQPTSRPSESRRALSPAQMKSPRVQASTPRSKRRPQTTPGGPRVHSTLGSDDGQKRQKEFFKAELTRLQRSLKDESSKIHKPKHREHYPFVWTSLEPYYNTYVARFLIDAAEDPQPGYVSRNTAIGLCDPWTDLRMDRELLPRLETPSKKSRAKGAQNAKRGKSKEKPPNKGSTRLPKFPVVDFSSSKENATKCFPYSEVPKFRQEVMGRYKHDAPKKLNSDYSRTKDDFYRMDLDRLDEVHPINRPHMRKAYFAYLQNTPGSKKAIKECVKDLNGEQAQKAH